MIKDLNIDFEKFYMVGDKLEDLFVVENVGVKIKVLVKIGKEIIEVGYEKVDLVFDSLVDLVRFVK